MKSKTNKNQRAIALLSLLAGLVYSLSLILSVLNGVQSGSETLKPYWEKKLGKNVANIPDDFRKIRLKSNDVSFENEANNLINNTTIPLNYSEVDVIVNEQNSISFLGVFNNVFQTLIVIFLIPTIFYIPIQFYKLMFSVYKGEIFTYDNVERLSKLGWGMVLSLILISLLAYLNYFETKSMIVLENYHLAPPNIQGIVNFALVPIVILIAVQVMKKALLMKEEQDLTI